MSAKELAFEYCDNMVAEFAKVIKNPIRKKSSIYYTGVDLETACVVIAVLDENKRPVAGAYRYADVVRDGMVVDYIGAVQIVRELKQQIEKELDTELIYAAGAIPPGTDVLDSGAVKNVIQGAGFECTNLLDESTAANQVLQMKNGAVIDIGGGTTGISILKDGKVVLMLKFRSMCVGAEHKGSGVYSGKGDTRVTKVGKIIRATSLDELPQLINVLRGDMSLIGPRPPLTYHPWPIEEYTKEQLHMFDVRPGFSGWAQIHGRKDVEGNHRIDLNGW
mgnify:CR=1 FL=1